MKKIVLALIILSVACQNAKKDKGSETNEEINSTEQITGPIALDTIALPEIANWKSENVVFDTSATDDFNNTVGLIQRTTASTPGYLAINNIEVFEGSRYRISALVKANTTCNLFGLRLTSTYPNRADAVFNLSTQQVKGTNAIGDFEKESATIIDMGNGWYKCTLISEVFSNKIRVILGPTDDNRLIPNWESGTDELCDVHIMAESVMLEEIEL